MTFLSGLTRLVCLAAPAALLAACTATIEPSPLPRAPQMCTFEHAPVCARRGGEMRSFSNSCLARAEGFRIVHPGACRSAPVACTREYRPVCARRGPHSRSFANSCLAEAEGYRVMHPGQCR